MHYLHEQQYYVDLYDLQTIEECLDYYWAIKDGFAKDRKKFKKFSDDEFKKEAHKCTSYAVNIIKIERYRRKAETIKKWMDKDKRTQELYDNAVPPQEIYCKECHSPTKVTNKDLYNSYEENAQVLFMFRCIKCNKGQAFYEDGTEWHYEPPECPKCKSPLNSDSKDNDDVMTTTYSCSNCSYRNKDVYDFKASREKREQEEIRKRKLLAEYRKDFCYDDEVGSKAVMNLDNIIRFAKGMEQQKQKEKDPIYQKAKQLKKITVAQLKELIIKAIEKEGYKDLQFDKPEMGQYVIIPFTVQETNDKRKEYNTIHILQKLIKTALEDTNWRLMSEGISYRLGYVYGRLKGYEREEDFMQLVK
jgi:phage FluMu protein Com